MKYDINLVNPQWSEEPADTAPVRRRFNIVLLSVLLISLSFLFFMYSSFNTFLILQKKEQHVKQLQENISNPELPVIQTDISTLTYLSNFHISKLEWAGRIELLIDKLPEGFSLSGLACRKKQVEIKGSFKAVPQRSPLESIQLYINQLEESLNFDDLFSHLELKGLQHMNGNQGKMYVFTLHAMNAL